MASNETAHGSQKELRQTSTQVARRYNFDRRGALCIVWLSILLFVLAASYFALHRWWRRPIQTLTAPETLVAIDDWGRTTLKSADDIDWNVGKEKALPLLTQMEQRSQQIQSALTRLHDSLQELRELVGPMRKGGVTHIVDAVQTGNFTNASRLVTRLRHELSPATLGAPESKLIARLETLLSDLAELKAQQPVTRANLRTPDRYVIFWMTPKLVLLEVIWWSLFGLLTSLLFNVAKHQRKKQFKPAEQWIIYSKVIYTPFIGLVLVLALWAGLISMGGPESRVWLLPLLSFLVGFNVRKAVRLVDALSEWVLNRAHAALTRTDAQRAAERAAQLEPYRQAMPAAFLSELRAEAKAKARELILQEFTKRELDA